MSDAPVAPAAASLPTSMVFVDGTNLDLRCVQCFSRNDIDFQKFFSILTAGTDLRDVYYFTADYKNEADRRNQQGVLNRLKKMGVKVKLGRHLPRTVTCKSCGERWTTYSEKGTDVGTAVSLVQAALMKSADRLFLVAGDNDYVPAMEMAKVAGRAPCLGFVVGPHENKQRKWLEIANMRHNSSSQVVLDDAFMSKCWFQA